MDRRAFIGRVAIGLLAVPLVARAQQPAMPVIGFLGSASPAQWSPFVAAFRKGLNEAGYIEGQNVTIEFRWAEGQYDRLPAMAAELAQRRVAVIVAAGGTAAALAARKASATIPIVFSGGDDPVAQGLVASLGRPGGNVTGVTLFGSELMAKRVELLHEFLPKAGTIAVLVSADAPANAVYVNEARRATRATRQQLEIFRVRQPRDIDAAVASIAQAKIGALIVAPDPLFQLQRERLVALTARHAVSTLFGFREFVAAGGLMSYGPSIADAYRSVGIYTGRILDGAKPAELPVLQPTKLELVINLKTAKALGLTVPQSLLLRADEVIQ
jgi:putative tryptophan/tyrosine transport system substrate-binding protein